MSSRHLLFALLSLTVVIGMMLLVPGVQAQGENSPVLHVSFDKIDGEKLGDQRAAYRGKIKPDKSRLVGGVSGQALEFDGTEDQAAWIKSDRVKNITKELTISLWVKANRLADTQAPISRNWNWRLRIAPDMFEACVGGEQWRKTVKKVYSRPIQTDKWYHVCYTYSTADATFALYVNGERTDIRQKQKFAPLRNEGEAPVLLGADPANYNLFNGAIDELAIYDTALELDQIRDVFARHAADIVEHNWEHALERYGQQVAALDTDELRESYSGVQASVKAALSGECSWAEYARARALMAGLDEQIYGARLEGAIADTEHGRLASFVVRPFRDEPILSDTRLPIAKLSDEINLRGAPSEYLSASFVLRPADEDVEKLRFNVSPLRSSDSNAVIAAENIDLRTVKCWYQAGSAWSGLRLGGRKPVLVPELLLHNDDLVAVDPNTNSNHLMIECADGTRYVCISNPHIRQFDGQIVAGNEARVDIPVAEFPVRDDSTSIAPLTVRADTNKQCWLTVHIPQDAPPGDYSATIDYSTIKGIAGSIELQLQVLPIQLTDPKTHYDAERKFTSSVYYRSRLSNDSKPYIGSEFKSQQQLQSEIENMADHDLDFIQNRTPLSREQDMQNYMAIVKEAGIDSDALYYSGISSNLGIRLKTDAGAMGKLKQRAKALKAVAEKYGYARVYTYAIDELKPDKISREIKAWKAMHDAGIGVFVAGRHGVADVAAKTLDVLVCSRSLLQKTAAKMHQHGNRVFSYGNPQSGPENPKMFRVNYGIKLWKHNYDGAMTYAYQSAFGTVWNDFDGHVKNYRDHQFTYPTSTGVIDTMAWEGYRQAKQDVAYASKLKLLADKYAASDDAARAKVARRARQYLQSLDISVNTDLDRVRAQLIDYILHLQSD